MNTYKYNMGFEAEVRRVAEAVWGLEPGACQPEHYADNPAVRELDGIARLRDVTYLVMATTSSKLDKVKTDCKKLNAAEKIEEKLGRAVKKWLITEKQLDAEHIHLARTNNVTTLTLVDFRRRFFDGRKYISLRHKIAFGSARNPLNDSINFAEGAYVPLPIREVDTSNGIVGAQKLLTLKEIQHLVSSGEVVIVVAPFGSGKSLTTRELFSQLSNAYCAEKINHVPVCLNLREHWGQPYSDEILERHARSLGYAPKEDLVVAWRAGMTCLLLDGFDEVASQSVVRTDDKNFMREARRAALAGVRDFLTKLPDSVGVWVCGRDHYFDSLVELTHALGIGGRRFRLLRLDEFTEEGAHDYLRRNGIDKPLPDWLPRKPLLLGYLTQQGLFEEILGIDSSKGFGHAWDSFLRKITEREAGLENAAMEPLTLRAVMERLSVIARSRSSGTGPISGTDLSEAYMAETRQVAGEGVLAQLQRLPGLTPREQETGTRSFVDEDMLAALQGGAFAKQIMGQAFYAGITPLSGLRPKAISMAGFILKQNGTTSETVISAAERAFRQGARRPSDEQLIADAAVLALYMAVEEGASEIDFRGITVVDSMLDNLPIEEFTPNRITFDNCVITEVELGQATLGGSISFRNCQIGRVSGVANTSGLPGQMFQNCQIDEFDELATNTAVQNSSLEPQLKAMITILRKLYLQPGAGRKLGALRRGITSVQVDSFVDRVLEILQRDGMISIYNKIVHPVRKQHARVHAILSAPVLSSDPLVAQIRALG